MEVRDRIDAILAGDRSDEESSVMSEAESIKALIGEYGWEPVRDYMVDILQDDRRGRDWRTVTDVFCGAVLDQRELPGIELIAWLYHRFDPDGRAEDNEVWSIASRLRGVGHLSDYKPLQDPEVLQHLRAIHSRAEPGSTENRGGSNEN